MHCKMIDMLSMIFCLFTFQSLFGVFVCLPIFVFSQKVKPYLCYHHMLMLLYFKLPIDKACRLFLMYTHFIEVQIYKSIAYFSYFCYYCIVMYYLLVWCWLERVISWKKTHQETLQMDFTVSKNKQMKLPWKRFRHIFQLCYYPWTLTLPIMLCIWSCVTIVQFEDAV